MPRNNSIEMMRLVAAILIVGIHTAPFYEINKVAGFYATEVATRTAVPFFFLVSGYFFFKSKKPFMGIFAQYLIPYIIVSIIYFSCDYYATSLGHTTFNAVLKYLDEKKLSFFVFGSWYHLWYFPAVMVSLIIYGIAKRLHLTKATVCMSLLFYIFGVLSCAYQKVILRLPVIPMIVTNPYFEAVRRILLMGLPFFGLGFFIDDLKSKWEKVTSSKKRLTVLIIIWILYIAEILFIRVHNCYDNVVLTCMLYPLVGYIMILLLLYPVAKCSKMGGVFKGHF